MRAEETTRATEQHNMRKKAPQSPLFKLVIYLFFFYCRVTTRKVYWRGELNSRLD